MGDKMTNLANNVECVLQGDDWETLLGWLLERLERIRQELISTNVHVIAVSHQQNSLHALYLVLVHQYSLLLAIDKSNDWNHQIFGVLHRILEAVLDTYHTMHCKPDFSPLLSIRILTILFILINRSNLVDFEDNISVSVSLKRAFNILRGIVERNNVSEVSTIAIDLCIILLSQPTGLHHRNMNSSQIFPKQFIDKLTEEFLLEKIVDSNNPQHGATKTVLEFIFTLMNPHKNLHGHFGGPQNDVVVVSFSKSNYGQTFSQPLMKVLLNIVCQLVAYDFTADTTFEIVSIAINQLSLQVMGLMRSNSPIDAKHPSTLILSNTFDSLLAVLETVSNIISTLSKMIKNSEGNKLTEIIFSLSQLLDKTAIVAIGWLELMNISVEFKDLFVRDIESRTIEQEPYDAEYLISLLIDLPELGVTFSNPPGIDVKYLAHQLISMIFSSCHQVMHLISINFQEKKFFANLESGLLANINNDAFFKTLKDSVLWIFLSINKLLPLMPVTPAKHILSHDQQLVWTQSISAVFSICIAERIPIAMQPSQQENTIKYAKAMLKILRKLIKHNFVDPCVLFFGYEGHLLKISATMMNVFYDDEEVFEKSLSLIIEIPDPPKGTPDIMFICENLQLRQFNIKFCLEVMGKVSVLAQNHRRTTTLLWTRIRQILLEWQRILLTISNQNSTLDAPESKEDDYVNRLTLHLPPRSKGSIYEVIRTQYHQNELVQVFDIVRGHLYRGNHNNSFNNVYDPIVALEVFVFFMIRISPSQSPNIEQPSLIRFWCSVSSQLADEGLTPLIQTSISAILNYLEHTSVNNCQFLFVDVLSVINKLLKKISSKVQIAIQMLKFLEKVCSLDLLLEMVNFMKSNTQFNFQSNVALLLHQLDELDENLRYILGFDVDIDIADEICKYKAHLRIVLNKIIFTDLEVLDLSPSYGHTDDYSDSGLSCLTSDQTLDTYEIDDFEMCAKRPRLSSYFVNGSISVSPTPIDPMNCIDNFLLRREILINLFEMGVNNSMIRDTLSRYNFPVVFSCEYFQLMSKFLKKEKEEIFQDSILPIGENAFSNLDGIEDKFIQFVTKGTENYLQQMAIPSENAVSIASITLSEYYRTTLLLLDLQISSSQLSQQLSRPTTYICPSILLSKMPSLWITLMIGQLLAGTNHLQSNVSIPFEDDCIENAIYAVKSLVCNCLKVAETSIFQDITTFLHESASLLMERLGLILSHPKFPTTSHHSICILVMIVYNTCPLSFESTNDQLPLYLTGNMVCTRAVIANCLQIIETTKHPSALLKFAWDTCFRVGLELRRANAIDTIIDIFNPLFLLILKNVASGVLIFKVDLDRMLSLFAIFLEEKVMANRLKAIFLHIIIHLLTITSSLEMEKSDLSVPTAQVTNVVDILNALTRAPSCFPAEGANILRRGVIETIQEGPILDWFCKILADTTKPLSVQELEIRGCLLDIFTKSETECDRVVEPFVSSENYMGIIKDCLLVGRDPCQSSESCSSMVVSLQKRCMGFLMRLVSEHTQSVLKKNSIVLREFIGSCLRSQDLSTTVAGDMSIPEVGITLLGRLVAMSAIETKRELFHDSPNLIADSIIAFKGIVSFLRTSAKSTSLVSETVTIEKYHQTCRMLISFFMLLSIESICSSSCKTILGWHLFQHDKIARSQITAISFTDDCSDNSGAYWLAGTLISNLILFSNFIVTDMNQTIKVLLLQLLEDFRCWKALSCWKLKTTVTWLLDPIRHCIGGLEEKPGSPLSVELIVSSFELLKSLCIHKSFCESLMNKSTFLSSANDAVIDTEQFFSILRDVATRSKSWYHRCLALSVLSLIRETLYDNMDQPCIGNDPVNVTWVCNIIADTSLLITRFFAESAQCPERHGDDKPILPLYVDDCLSLSWKLLWQITRSIPLSIWCNTTNASNDHGVESIRNQLLELCCAVINKLNSDQTVLVGTDKKFILPPFVYTQAIFICVYLRKWQWVMTNEPNSSLDLKRCLIDRVMTNLFSLELMKEERDWPERLLFLSPFIGSMTEPTQIPTTSSFLVQTFNSLAAIMFATSWTPYLHLFTSLSLSCPRRTALIDFLYSASLAGESSSDIEVTKKMLCDSFHVYIIDILTNSVSVRQDSNNAVLSQDGVSLPQTRRQSAERLKLFAIVRNLIQQSSRLGWKQQYFGSKIWTKSFLKLTEMLSLPPESSKTIIVSAEHIMILNILCLVTKNSVEAEGDPAIELTLNDNSFYKDSLQRVSQIYWVEAANFLGLALSQAPGRDYDEMDYLFPISSLLSTIEVAGSLVNRKNSGENSPSSNTCLLSHIVMNTPLFVSLCDVIQKFYFFSQRVANRNATIQSSKDFVQNTVDRNAVSSVVSALVIMFQCLEIVFSPILNEGVVSQNQLTVLNWWSQQAQGVSIWTRLEDIIQSRTLPENGKHIAKKLLFVKHDIDLLILHNQQLFLNRD